MGFTVKPADTEIYSTASVLGVNGSVYLLNDLHSDTAELDFTSEV